jgi:outer membrane protein assembly factor BamB
MSIIVVAVAFRDCGDPTIKTGAGRTSDVAVARANASLVVLDTGTGREIGRVPVGVLTPNGERVYSTHAGCRGNAESTTLSRSEIATLKTEELGCIAGQVSAAAVDEAVNVVYVSDTAGQRLSGVDLQGLAVRSSVNAPPDQPALFDPRWLVEDGASILAVGQVADGAASQSVIVRRVALPALDLSAGARFPAEDLTMIRLVPTSDGRVLAYDASTGRLRELDVARGQLLSATDLPGHQGVAEGRGSVAAHPIVLSSDERTLFAAVPEGGIVVLDIPGGQVIRRMNLEHHYLSIALGSGDGMIYAVESGNVYVVLDAASGKELIRRPNLPLSDILEVSRGQ